MTYDEAEKNEGWESGAEAERYEVTGAMFVSDGSDGW